MADSLTLLSNMGREGHVRPAWTDLSITMGPLEAARLAAEADITDRSFLASETLQEPFGGRNSDDLSETFFEILQSSKSPDAAETLLRFAQTCDDSLEKIDAWERFSSRNSWLAEESNSWRLLHCLYLNSASASASRFPEECETPSPKRLVIDYFQTDEEIRLMQTVVDWLERCTSFQDSAIPPAGRVGGNLHWENTLHHLQNGMSLFDSSANGTLVSALDPDAPNREKKNLHALDRQDDDNLSRRLFKEIRCGRFEEAVSLCVDSGQMWRGIILQGQRLLDYPEPPQLDAKYPLVGNPSRDLWKWSCMEFLKNADENVHFKACLGILCGHLQSVLPVCGETWEDLLWAHLRVQIEHKVDRYLREHHDATYLISSGDLLDDDEDTDKKPELSMQQIFNCVKSLHKNKSESNYQETQRYLILDQIDLLLKRALSWIDKANFDLIRFVAHLVLIFRQIGKDPLHNVGDDILKVYVKNLINNVGKFTVSPELIAYYTSTLPMKMQTELFSELMWSVELKEDRQRVIEAGNLANLDVQSAARETVRFAIRSLKEHCNKEASPFTESDDKSKSFIHRVTSCLEWLSFHNSQIIEAVMMSNAIIRVLVFKGDIESAAAVLSRLTQFYPTTVIAQNLPSTSNALREHFCLKAYLEAINGYAAWYRQHVGGRPKSPEPLLPNCSFTEKVHHDQIKTQVSLQQKQWATSGMHQANHIKQLLYNVLLFPEGWLVDDVASSDRDQNSNVEELIEREIQLDSLRKLCIPEVVLLLLKVLQSGDIESHSEAIRISELLASDKRKLYLLFPKNKLREVLHKIGESSLVVLENNRDPWGFESNV